MVAKDSYDQKSTVSSTISANSLSLADEKEQISDIDEDKVDGGAATDSTPIPLYHKPPQKQFVLIMIAYVLPLLPCRIANPLLRCTDPTFVLSKKNRLSLCVFLASLDQIIVSTSIPAITKQFHALGDISWLATAYMLTSTASQPLYGKVSDIFGRKTVVLFANFMFLVGSCISGWATSMVMLIVGRGVAGIGAGGMMAMVVSESFDCVCVCVCFRNNKSVKK